MHIYDYNAIESYSRMHYDCELQKVFDKQIIINTKLIIIVEKVGEISGIVSYSFNKAMSFWAPCLRPNFVFKNICSKK